MNFRGKQPRKKLGAAGGARIIKRTIQLRERKAKRRQKQEEKWN
jgi:hypothetical protein